jgi:lipopolysaccharide transport system ATP-binding protein
MAKSLKTEKPVAISVHGVNKSFRLYHEKRNSLRDFFYHFGKGSSYEKFDALKNINFELRKGEFLGIIGRNGSGKSTLLKLLAGVYLPDSGEIKVNGRLIPFLELGVGFNPELTGRENVFLNGTIMGLTKKELTAQFDEIVDFAEVREFIDMPLKKYSSGMQVRLAFSIAIKADADIYLLDEILAVGDANFQAKSMAQFRNFKDKGKTVILVTHDLSAVNQYCDKAIYIKDHEIVAAGKPSDLIDKYIYEDRDKEREAAGQSTIKTGANTAKIESVEFIDKEGTKNSIFISGDPITIKTTYRVKNTVQNPVFGIALYKDDGQHLFGDNTLLSKSFNTKEISKGIYEVSVTIPKLNILRGNILVTLALTDDKYENQYIWEDKKYGFSVISSKAHDGLVNLDTKWSVVSK